MMVADDIHNNYDGVDNSVHLMNAQTWRRIPTEIFPDEERKYTAS